MTWLTNDRWIKQPAGERFAALLVRPGILRAPGAHNAMAGLLAKRAGFECLYVSGAAVTASMGLPDLGVIGLDELCHHVRSIYRATQLPLIVDADTGYGEVLNVMRTVRELEAAGAAAVQIEDQLLPKKCGHLNDKQLASPEDMARKVEAAHRARTHLRIIARTDAVAQEGLEGGIERARLYIEAGADIVFADALTSEAMFRRFSSSVDCAAHGEHDGVRPHALFHRRAVRGDGLQGGDLAGLVAAHRSEGHGRHVCPPGRRRQHRSPAGLDAEPGGAL